MRAVRTSAGTMAYRCTSRMENCQRPPSHPKDKDTIPPEEWGGIYIYMCKGGQQEGYIGESGRTFRERFKEHLKAQQPSLTVTNTTGHMTIIENFSIVGKEDQNLA